MAKIRISLIALVAGLALAAAACSSGYDRDSAFDQLTDPDQGGFTDEQANCILDEVEAQDLEDEILEGNEDETTPEEATAITNIITECAIGDLDDINTDVLEPEAETGGTPTTAASE